MVHGIKRKKEGEKERNRYETRKGGRERSERWETRDRGDRGDRGERVRALSLATRSRTPVPTQHGTASHNRWKGNGGERDTPGGEDEKRTKEKEREIDRRRERPPLDPESANSNITIRPPRSKRRRTSRLPPSSYVFWSLALSLSSPFYSTYLFLAWSYLPRMLAPNLSFLSLPPSFLCASLLPLSPPQPPPIRRRCRRCISALTSANSGRPARKRRRQTRIHYAPVKWRTTECSPPWRTSSKTSTRNHRRVDLSSVGDFPANRIPMFLPV